MTDDWLDAFDPDEVLAPEHADADAAVSRTLARLGVAERDVVRGPPGARPRRWAWMAALAAGILLGLTVPRPWVADLPPPPAPVVLPAPAPAPVVIATPAPVVPARAPAPRVPPPPREPGLLPHPGAALAVYDGAAVLASGVVGYVHDARHDPGVDRVAWASVPVVARPMGTAFTAYARGKAAALAVTDGRVALDHLDGRRLATVDPGGELVAVATATDVVVVRTDGLPLDQVALAVPPGTDATLVVAAVAGLRLATTSTPLVDVVPPLHLEAP